MSDLQATPHDRRLSRLRPKQRSLIFGLIFAAGLALGAALWASHTRATEVQAPVSPPRRSDGFRPTGAQRASLQIDAVRSLSFKTEISADGAIAVNDEMSTPVFSPYSGRITRLVAAPGEAVKRGAALFFVEASEAVQAQNDLATAMAARSTAQSQLKLAEATEKRQHELLEAKAGAQKDWLQSQSDLIVAKNAVETTEINLAAVRNRLRILGKSGAEVAALESAAGKHAISAEAAVLAPIAGVVTQRQAGVGQYIASVSSGAGSPLYTIGDLSTVWLVANVRESDAPSLKLGAPVDVRVAAYPDKIFKAKITWIAPMLDSSTHRLPVRAVVDNRDGALKPLMLASFTIGAGDASDAPAVPQSAVIFDGAAARVWVARDDGTLAPRPIRLGRERTGQLEVVSGLAVGEKIVSSGTLFIDRAAQSEQR